jgi:hypothetical protein
MARGEHIEGVQTVYQNASSPSRGRKREILIYMITALVPRSGLWFGGRWLRQDIGY